MGRQALTFTVLGEPQPAGSKRAFVNKKTGRAIVTDDNRKAKPWQAEVKAAAAEAVPDGFELIRGPVQLWLVFYRQRPKSHYRTGRNAALLRTGAPARPITRPDALKLARACEDALTGLIWADDSQIVAEVLEKRYGEPARCEVRVRELTNEGGTNGSEGITADRD